MFLIFSFLILFVASESAQVPQCNQFSFDLNITDPRYTLIYTLSLDADIQNSSKTYHNHVTFSNIARWSLDEDVYYEYYPMFYYLQGTLEYVYCNDSKVYEFDIRDGYGYLSFSLSVGRYTKLTQNFLQYFFIGGSIYNSDGGRMFHPEMNPCFDDVIDDGHVIYFANVCCTNYFYIPAPDPIDAFCEEFSGETTYRRNGETVAHLKAIYQVSNTTIDVAVSEYSAPQGIYVNYYLQLNSELHISCYGNSPGCTMGTEVVLPDHDYSFHFSLDISNTPVWDYNSINGQLIYRNGIWVKDQNIPYTPEDPCWTRIADSNNDTTSITNFCCEQWIPVDICAEYGSKTIVNLDTDIIDVLNTRYVLNENDTMTVEIYNYTTTSNNARKNVQLEGLISVGQSQFCSANSTSGNTCLFKEPKNHDFTLIMRTADYPSGWDMVTVRINRQQITSPSITTQSPCYSETHTYNGLSPGIIAKTEICCIATVGGPWPGSI